MTTFQLSGEGYVIRDGDTKVPTVDTPLFPNTNPDFLAYKEWLAAGNVPLPAEPEPPQVPQSITRAQGKAALIQSGLWGGVLQVVASIEDQTERALAEVALHDTLTWQRTSPFLNTAAAALGMDSEALDALFSVAASIEL